MGGGTTRFVPQKTTISFVPQDIKNKSRATENSNAFVPQSINNQILATDNILFAELLAFSDQFMACKVNYWPLIGLSMPLIDGSCYY